MIHNLKPVDPLLILAPVIEESKSIVEVLVPSCVHAGSVLEGGPPAARCHIAENEAGCVDEEVMPLGTGKGAIYTDNIWHRIKTLWVDLNS